MQIELKPCPFCGKAAQIAPDEIGSGGQHVPPYHAGCFRGAGCGIAFTADDPDEAIEEWNRRALTSATTPDVAGLIDKAVVEAIGALRVEQPGRAYDILSDALEASTALRLSAGGGWRTMDSAPRDGTEIIILAVCEDGRGYRVSDAFYARSDWQNREGWAVDGDGEYDWIEGGGMSAKLWAPYPTLPASPTVEAGHVE